MDKGMQSFLDVHTGTKGKCTTHDNTYLATVHLVEDVELLLDGHSRLDNNNLLGRNTSLDKLVANIFIKIEAG